MLVIDEINRADTARVFGELVTLLEPDKRLGQPEERQVVLPYSNELFGVPSELHLIGTMNTADRSLTLIDFALRRRFNFEEVGPEPTLCASPYAGIDLPGILSGWNERISAALSPDQRLGHAFLMQDKLEDVRIAEALGTGPDEELRAVAFVIRRKILPLLAEYFHADWRAIEFILGKNWATGVGGLLQFHSLEYLEDAADEVLDIDDASDYRLPDYWDPNSPNWDPTEFRQRVSLVV